MSQNVMITGAGKAVGLGFNIALRYLEAGSISKCYRTNLIDYGMA